MKKNKKLIKRIGCLIGAFMIALVSICSIIPNKKQNIDYASANDSSFNVSFSSQPIKLGFAFRDVSTGVIYSSGSDDGVNLFPFSFIFNLFSDSNGLGFSFSAFLPNNNPSIGGFYTADLDGGRLNVTNFGSEVYYDYALTYDFTTFYSSYFVSSSDFSVSDLDYLILSIDFSAVSNVDGVAGFDGGKMAIYSCSFYDINGSFFRFSFRSYLNSQQLRYTTLPIYNSTNYKISQNTDSYKQGYDAGKIEGYNSGKSEGYELGKEEGEFIGFNRGRGVGFNEGLAEANDYTFLSLISAVVDAPIQALTGLLNFEILGVNLLDFVTGLFTVGIILFIIKLIL